MPMPRTTENENGDEVIQTYWQETEGKDNREMEGRLDEETGRRFTSDDQKGYFPSTSRDPYNSTTSEYRLEYEEDIWDMFNL